MNKILQKIFASIDEPCLQDQKYKILRSIYKKRSVFEMDECRGRVRGLGSWGRYGSGVGTAKNE
jgi:hypothetical protein